MKRSLLCVRIIILFLLIIAIFPIFDDGLHLVESGKCILANNVIDRINNFILTHRHHPNIHIHTME